MARFTLDGKNSAVTTYQSEAAWWQQRLAALRPLAPAAFLAAGLALVFTHYLFLVTGYTGPDGLCEGLFWAMNLKWDVQLGRWMMAWSRQASLSIVMPALFFATNTIGIALASLLLADLWELRSRWFVVWTCIAFAVAPALVWQALVIHETLCFALAMLLAVAAVWLTFLQPSVPRLVLAVVCLAVSMGGYQAYVGIAAGLTLLTVMLACLRCQPLRPTLLAAGRMLGVGVLGGALYFGITQLELRRYGTTMADYCGANQIGLGQSLARLRPSLSHVYGDFLGYFKMETGHIGTWFWRLLVLTAVFGLVCRGLALVKRPAQLALLAASTALLPLACNAIDVIAPDVQIDRLMSYPMQFVLPFCLAVWALPAAPRVNRLTRAAGTALAAVVCWLFAISATATYRTVALSYEYVGTLTDSILNQVMADPDYTADSRLLMAGFPDESRVQDANALYWFSQYQRSPLFWGGTHGILDCWPTYLYDYHGFNAGGVTLAEYEDIVASAEFTAMPVYPQEGSMAYFGDVLVVKLEENPPQ